MFENTRRLRSRLGAGLVLPLLLVALGAGCSGTKLRSGGPFTALVKAPEGTLRYSLSKSVVVIEATVTRGASGNVTFDGNDFKVDAELVRTDATARMTIDTAVDDSQFFTLRLEHGSSSDDNLTVDIAPNGLLRSIGVSSVSQAASIVKDVVTVGASVVATIAASALGKDPRRAAIALVCEKLAADAGTPGRCAAAGLEPPVATPAAPPTTRAKPATKAGSPTPPASPSPTAVAAGCDKRTESSLAELSMPALFFLARSQKHRQLWTLRRDAEARLAERTCRRMELERSAERTPAKEIAEVRDRLELLGRLELAARVDLSVASTDLDLAVRDFQRATGIDGPTRTEVVRMTFDLDELPPPEVLTRAAVPDKPGRGAGMTSTETRAVLKAYPRVLDLYDRTGFAVSLTPPPVAVQGGMVWSTEATNDQLTRIYYRPSYTAALTMYGTVREADEQGGEQELLRLCAVASDDVVHPKMPVQGFAFEPADFAERRLALAFDDKGRLVRFEQSGRSSLAGATAAAAESVRSARDEYAATLLKLAEIQDTERLLKQNEVITEIDRLTKQRSLLDARLELTGTRASYDLVLEKRRLDAQLGVLQSRNALADEKGAAAVSAEVGELRSKLEQLARDLEEVKNRNNPGGIPTGGH